MTKFIYHNKLVILEGLNKDHILNVITQTKTFYEVSMLDYIQKLDLLGMVIDVGANIGNHSVYFAKFTNCKAVIAIEPYTEAAKKLKNNVSLNGVENRVQIVEAAAGEKEGHCSLELGPHTNIGMTKTKKGDSVKVVPLDGIVNNEIISLIKIDVEGNELDVLKGAAIILTTQSPYLFIEAATDEHKKPIDNYLEPLGYKSLKQFNATPTYLYAKQ